MIGRDGHIILILVNLNKSWFIKKGKTVWLCLKVMVYTSDKFK